MEEIGQIRKVIGGVSINTDTAHRVHLVTKLVSEEVSGQLQHRPIIQGLYQAKEGQYFLAFWNKLTWDDKNLGYTFEDEVMLIDPEQAKQWVRNYCPEKFDSFVASMDETDKPSSIQALTLRMNSELRNHLEFVSQISKQSLNKICLDHIAAGMSANSARSLLNLPRPDLILMPDGKQAVDKFEKALEFEDPDEKVLAGYAECLYSLFRFDYPRFLPFALHTFYKLIKINKNNSHALCFANWLSEFHRVTYEDGIEYRKKNPTELAY